MLLLSSSILIVIAVHDVFLACTQQCRPRPYRWRIIAAAATGRRRLNLHFPLCRPRSPLPSVRSAARAATGLHLHTFRYVAGSATKAASLNPRLASDGRRQEGRKVEHGENEEGRERGKVVIRGSKLWPAELHEGAEERERAATILPAFLPSFLFSGIMPFIAQRPSRWPWWAP